MKPSPRRHAMPRSPRAAQTFTLQPLALAVLMAWTPAWAGPNGAQVVAGQATISQTAPGQQLITQGTHKAVIDWQGFSIGANESVRIQQPSASSVLLNRVVGTDPSHILGQMQANGRVFLLNPYGVVFGAGARIDVGGLVASTLDMSNADFMAGNFRLTSAGGPAQRGIVRNDGTISAPGGTVALAGPNVVNTGTITADGGRAGLAAADSVLVDVEGDGLIFFQTDAAQATNKLEQLGRLQADGGSVEVRAAARGAFADTVLNLGGVVQARSFSSHNGRIVIDGGAEGIVQVAGRLDASSTEAGQAGGHISVEGQRLKLADGAVLDASGTAGGGAIHVGGGFQGQDPALRNALVTTVAEGATLRADATAQGDGGQVVVWSDDTTRFAGTISSRGGTAGGNGGDVEVSGKQTLLFRGDVDTRAPRGERGTLLLDPDDLVVSNDAGAIDDADVSVAAGGANVTVSANYLSGYTGATITLAAGGDITFKDSVVNTTPGTSLTATAGAALTVNAGKSVQVDGDLTLAGASLMLQGNLGSDAGTVRLTGPIELRSQDIAISGASVVIDDTVSSTQRALAVTATGAGGITLKGDIALGSGSSRFTGPVTLGADVQITSAGTTFDDSVSGSSHALTLLGGGTKSLQAVDVASLSTGSAGSTVLHGDVTTSSDQHYGGAVTAAAQVTLDAGSGTVSFGSTLNGTTADTESVTVTAGSTTFTGAVGGGTRLAALTVTNAARVDGGRVDAVTQSYGALEIGAATTLSGSSVTVTGATTQTGTPRALTIAATTTSLGAVTVGKLTVNGTATLNGDVSTSDTQQYTNVVLGADRQLTAAGGSDVEINGTLTGAHALSIAAGGTTQLRGAVSIGSLTTGAFGGTEIGSSITTTGGQTYGNAVWLAGNAALTAGSAGVDFQGTVNGGRTLSVDTAGETRFRGAVGGSTALASLSTGAGGLTRLGANVSTSGTQTYGDALQLDASVTLAATAGNLQFNGTVNAATAGTQSLTVNASGHAGFAAAVGASAALAGLDATAATLSLGDATTTGAVALAGNTTLGGSIATQGGSFSVTGPTTLGADTSIDSGSGAIGFTGAVDGSSDGAQSLSLVSSGATTFGAAVGATQRLRTLTTDAGGSTTLRGVRTSGNQHYGDAVVVAANASLAGADLRFDDTLGGGVALQLAPTGTATLAGDASLQSLTVNGAASLGADVSTTLGQTYNGTLALSGPSTTLTASTLMVTGALDASVAGASALTVATTGAAVFQSAIGATRALGGFATGAGGSVSLPELHASGAVSLGNDATLNGDVFTGGGDFSAAGTTTLAGTARRIETGAGDAVFTGAVAASADGVQSLVVQSSGTTRFDAGAGASGQALAGLATDAAGSTVLGGSFYTSGDQLFGDAVTLGATTTIDAGNVHFANGLALGANDLVLQLGGNFDLDGGIGGTGFVSVAPRLASQKIYVGSGTAAADEQQFDLGNLGGGDLSALPRIGIGRTDGSGTMRVDALTLGADTKLQTGSGDILLTGTIHGSHQLEVATTSGRIELQNINVNTGSASQSYAGDLVVGGTSVLTGNGVTMHGNIDAAGAGTSQLVIIGSGSFALDGHVGSAQALSFFGLGTALSLQQDLSITASTVTLGAVTGNGHALTVNSAGVTTFGGAVSGVSTLTTDAAGSTLLAADVATTGNQHYGDAVTLDATAMLTATAGSVRFGASVNGASRTLTVDAANGTTFDGAVSLAALDVRQAATVNGGSIATTGSQHFRGTVTLGAGTSTFTGSSVTFDGMVSGSGALRVNGAATLHADVDTTGAQTYDGALTLADDLRLASNSSIDFRGTVNGSAHALTLDAAGGTSFGAAALLASLDVTGAASLGSVAITTSGAQRWRGALGLAGNATLASTGAGWLRLDGAIDGPGSLAVNTAGATQFNAAIGTTQALASLTTDAPGSTTLAGNVRTSGTVTFNDALTLAANATLTAGSATFASTVGGAHGLTVNTAGLTSFGGAVDVASLATDASGSTTLAAGVRTTGAQSFGDRVTLGGNFVIESGGALGFGGGITAGSHTLTLRAGGALTVGNTVTGSGAAVIEPVAVGTSLGIAGGSGTLQIAQATLNQFSGMPSLTLGRSDGSGAIDVGALVLPTTLTLRSGSGAVNFGAAVDSAAGFAHGLAVDTTALTTFAGSVGAANALGSLSVTHAAQVDAAVVRTSGSQHYAGALSFGAASELHAPALLLDAGLAAGAHDVALFTDSLGLAGSVSGTGSARLAAFSAGGSIGLAGAGGTLQLSQSLLDQFAGLSLLRIGRSDGTGAVTANSLSLATGTTLDNGSGSVTLGAVTGNGHALAVNSAGVTTFGGPVSGVSTLTTDAAGSTHLAAGVATTGNQHYGDALTLDAAATLTSAAGGVRFGGSVGGTHTLTTDAAVGTTFDGAVSLAALDVKQAATVNGGSVATTGSQHWGGAVALGADTTFAGSTVTFDAGVSGAHALTVNASTTLHDDVSTTGAQTYGGTLTLADDVTLTSAGSIGFTGTVSGPHALTLDAAGGTNFGGAVSIASLDVLRAASLSHATITTSGAQRWRGALGLTGNATLASTGAGVLRFDGAIDGPGSLTVNTAGATEFNAAIGATQALATLTTDAAGSTTLAGNVRTSGALTVNDALTLGGNTTVTAGSATFASTIDGAHALAVNAGTTTFGAAVGGGTALASLTTDAAGSTHVGADITTTGQQHYGDAVMLTAATNFTAGTLAFDGPLTAGSHQLGLQADALALGGTVSGSGTVSLAPSLASTTIGLAGGAGTYQLSQATLSRLTGFSTLAIGRSDGSGDIHVGHLVLAMDTALQSGSGTIHLDGGVDSAAGTHHDLTVHSAALTRVGGAIGNTTALGTFTVGGDVRLGSALVAATTAQHYGGSVTLAADTLLSAGAVDIAGALALGTHDLSLHTDALSLAAAASGTGTARLATFGAGGSIGIAGGAGTLQLSQSLLDRFAGLSQLSIGRSDGSGAISAGAFMLPTALAIDSGSGAVTLAGTVGSAGTARDLRITTGGLTTVAGALGGSGALRDVAIAGAVALAADTAISADRVDFAGTVDGAHALTVDAAATRFGGAVGATTALASLTTDAAGHTTLGAGVRTSGAQHYGDDVVLAASSTLQGSTLTFAGTLDGTADGAQSLVLDAADTTLGGAAGGTTRLGSFTTTGRATLAGGSVSSTGAQSYGSAVTLAADTTLAGAGLAFAGTVDGAHALVLRSSGLTRFGGAVGAATALASLDAQLVGTVQLAGASIETLGAQHYGGALQLNGDTRLAGSALAFDGAVSGAADLRLQADTLTVGAGLAGSGVLAIATRDAAGSIGVAGGSGDLQVTQAVLDSASGFTRHVIGRGDGSGMMNVGALTLRANTLLRTGSADLRLDGGVNGGFDLALDSGGATRITRDIGTQVALRSLTTDNQAGAADWNGSSGEHTRIDSGNGSAVRIVTSGAQTFLDPLVTGSAAAFAGSTLSALHAANAFGGAVSLAANSVQWRSASNLQLADVALTGGGSVEADGTIELAGALQLQGGTLSLVSNAPPSAIGFTDAALQNPLLNLRGVALAEASAAIFQSGGTLTSHAGSLLSLRATGGGSILLEQTGNALAGEISAVSGTPGDTSTARFDNGSGVTLGFVRIASSEIHVAGTPPAAGEAAGEAAGLEADAIKLSTDWLTTGATGQIRARLPYENLQGFQTSVPGLTLVMGPKALAANGGFGGAAPESWVQVHLGGVTGGYLSVLPKGAGGQPGSVLVGGRQDPRPFYDGEGKAGEVRMFYNGSAPRTPQEQGALTAVTATVEEARQARFDDAVRTENVSSRLRSGVIAEVGAGRPATVGSESIRMPEVCDPAPEQLSCE